MKLTHQNISLVKSIIRIIGFGLLAVNLTLLAVAAIVFAELLGVVEEHF